MPTALMFLADGFEEVEAITPLDLLRRADVQVTTVALGAHMHVTGRCQVTLHADATLDALPSDVKYDLLILPGGPGVKALRADSRVLQRVVAQHQSGAWLAAICAAPTVLHDAGLLTHRRYTAHQSVKNELTAIIESERVVVDGTIITSRGAGTALDFGLKLVEVIAGASKAKDVRASIHA